MSQLIGLLMLIVFSGVDTPIVVNYPPDVVENLVGQWHYFAINGQYGMFEVTEDESGVLYYVMYGEDNQPSERVPPLRMVLTNGMSFKTFSDEGLVSHMVFVDQRQGGSWNVMLLINDHSIPMVLQKVNDVPEAEGGHQVG